jgi:arylsulfatase
MATGFEHLFHSIGGEANQFYPSLTEDTTPVHLRLARRKGYDLTEDLVDKVRRWLSRRRTFAGYRPAEATA